MSKFYVLLMLSVLITGCNKKSSDRGNETVDSKNEILSKDFCPELVAKFGECSKNNSSKGRFNFTSLKQLIYEDCRKIEKSDPEKYIKLYQCIEKNCKQLNTCLQEIMDKESPKTK
jgi:hypothetical protein